MLPSRLDSGLPVFMTLSRRRFLQFTTTGLVIGQSGCAGLQSLAPTAETPMLDSYIDALLPADSTPGALELGVAMQVRKLLLRKRSLQPVYETGLRWLEGRAQSVYGVEFPRCSLGERDTLVLQLSEQTDELIDRFFYKSLRHVRMFYYSNPQSWQALGLANTPQPLGFMNYTQAPRTHD